MRRAAAGALLLAACGAGGPNGEGALIVSPDAVHTLTSLDGVTRVVDVQPTGDGRVWVLNSTAPWFVVLAPDGRVERRFGERGGGPEEFDAPVALVRGADPAEVWTYDVVRNALIRISAGGRREVPLPRDSIPVPSLVSFKGAGVNPAPLWLESTRDGLLVARVRPASSQPESALRLWNADILLLREDGPEAGVALHTPIADLLGDPASTYRDATTLLPYPLWTACADGTVVLYDPLANALRRVPPEGEELGAFPLPDERRVRMTEEAVFEMFYRQLHADASSSAQIPPKAQFRSLVEAQTRQFVSSSARVFPEYADLRCASDGTLWLQRFDATHGRLGHGSDWLRVSPDGARTPVALPRVFTAFRIEGGRIWGTVEDALGVESIAWIGLDSRG